MQVNRNELIPTDDENRLLRIKEDDEGEETEQEDEKEEEEEEMEEDEEERSNESVIKPAADDSEENMNTEKVVEEEKDNSRKSEEQPIPKPTDEPEKSDAEWHSWDKDDNVAENIDEGDPRSNFDKNLDALIEDIQHETKIKDLEEQLKKAAERESSIKLELKDSQKRVNDLEKEQNARIDKEQELETELKRARGRIEELERKVSYLEKENMKLKCDNDRMRAAELKRILEDIIIPDENPVLQPSSLVKHVKTRQRTEKKDAEYTYEKKKGKKENDSNDRGGTARSW